MFQQNPFNPYQVNPAYANQMNGYHPINQSQIIKVNGRGGAEAYQMMPNSQALLLDETMPILWLKQTDGAGYPTITAYDIKPHEEKPMPNMDDLEKRITRIEEVLSNEPDITNNRRKKSNVIPSEADG